MTMLIQQTIFFAFAAVTVLAALATITSHNPVRAVLFLVLAFFSTAGIWIFAEAEFLALILVLVYVGAVMTLFLFVVMMMDIDSAERKKLFVKHLPLALLVLATLLGVLIFEFKHGELLTNTTQPMVAASAQMSQTKMLGRVLYTDYAYPFEIAGLLLLVAIVAAITLVHRSPRNAKTQDIEKQLQTQRSDRLRIVKMKPEVGDKP